MFGLINKRSKENCYDKEQKEEEKKTEKKEQRKKKQNF